MFRASPTAATLVKPVCTTGLMHSGLKSNSEKIRMEVQSFYPTNTPFEWFRLVVIKAMVLYGMLALTMSNFTRFRIDQPLTAIYSSGDEA